MNNHFHPRSAGPRRLRHLLITLAAMLTVAGRAAPAAGGGGPLFTTDLSVQSVSEAHGGRTGLQYDAGLDS